MKFARQSAGEGIHSAVEPLNRARPRKVPRVTVIEFSAGFPQSEYVVARLLENYKAKPGTWVGELELSPPCWARESGTWSRNRVHRR